VRGRGFLIELVSWKINPEGRAAPELRIEAYAASHVLDQLAGDV
jgi:hypothetical protein